jgi:hypothetical protein
MEQEDHLSSVYSPVSGSLILSIREPESSRPTHSSLRFLDRLLINQQKVSSENNMSFQVGIDTYGNLSFNHSPISHQAAYIQLLDEVTRITSLLPLFHNKNESVEKLFRLFEDPLTEESMMKEVPRHILEQKNSHRTSVSIGKSLLKKFKEDLIDIVLHAFCQNKIDHEDLKVYMSNMLSFPFWKSIITRNEISRLAPLRKNTNYQPWIIAIKKLFLEVEEKYRKEILCYLKLPTTPIQEIRHWLDHKEKQGIILWLAQFLFRDYYFDSKRKFLFITGKAHVGKSFFIDLLLPNKFFTRMQMQTDFFTAYPKGEYSVNAMIWDDPGQFNGKEHRLDTDFFLRLARFGDEGPGTEFQTKNGFVHVKYGQLVISNNLGITHMFPQETRKEAIISRLNLVSFDENPFPLLCKTLETAPFEFFPRGSGFTVRSKREDLNSPFQSREQDPFDDFPDELPPEIYSFFEEDFQEIFFEEDSTFNDREQSPQEESFQPSPLDRDLASYFLWRAILEVFDYNLDLQVDATREVIMPAEAFRSRTKDYSLYNIVTQTQDETLESFVGFRKI